MDDFDVVTSPYVEFFRNSEDYSFVWPSKVRMATVFTMSMYNRNPNVNGQPVDVPARKCRGGGYEIQWDRYQSGLERKFTTLFRTIEEHNYQHYTRLQESQKKNISQLRGTSTTSANHESETGSRLAMVNTLILCDIGCGVYQNDPGIVGSAVGNVIKRLQDEGLFQHLKKIIFTGKHEFYSAASRSVRASTGEAFS